MRWLVLSCLIGLIVLAAVSIPKDENGRERISSYKQNQDTLGNRNAPPYTSAQPIPKPVMFAPGVISTGDDESHPTFTADGNTLYYLKNTPMLTHWTILISHFKDGRWSTPKVAPFSGRYKDADVSFSQEGNTLFFISNRPIEEGGTSRADTDIWMMQKTDTGWGDPQYLAILSSPYNEWFPTVTNDGTIYFGSERREGNQGPKDTSDLWRSRLVDGQYTKPENLGDGINTSGQDIEVYIAPMNIL